MPNIDFNSMKDLILMFTYTPSEIPYGVRCCLVIILILVLSYLIYNSYVTAEYYGHMVPRTDEERKKLMKKQLESVTWFFVYIYTSALLTVCVIAYYLIF